MSVYVYSVFVLFSALPKLKRLVAVTISIDLTFPAALWLWGLLSLLTEMSTRNLPGGKGRPARKTDNLTVICGPIVYKMSIGGPLKA
jgi:hypothetical protein